MIGRGTTPIIEYLLEDIDPQNIVTAYVTITQNDEEVIERDIETMERGESSVEWKLTQEETLKLDPDYNGIIQLRVKTVDGSAYASEPSVLKFMPINKDGVI